MKKFVTTLVLLAGAASVYAQGQINYSDYNPGATTGFNIHIWSPQLATPAVETTGNSTIPFVANRTAAGLAGDAPTGTSNPGYSGQMIGGSGYAASATLDYSDGDSFNVELYAAAGTVSSFSGLEPIPGTICTIADGSYGPAYAGLYFVTGTGLLTLNGTGGTPVVAPGAAATFALAVWFNGGGTYPSLAAAQASGGGSAWATSPVGTENIGGGIGQPPLLPGLGNPNTLAGGITSFAIVGPQEIPEPSTIALVVIGASTFLTRLNHKQ
jgi:hypothetical protein